MITLAICCTLMQRLSAKMLLGWIYQPRSYFTYIYPYNVFLWTVPFFFVPFVLGT